MRSSEVEVMCTAGGERSQGVTQEKGVPRTAASKWAGQSQGGESQGYRGPGAPRSQRSCLRVPGLP